jgi:EAL domain-containing protein (putative c-di-GMP-specific phosphodiesterase class I)/GGDEF domain-containing protein
MFSKSTKKVIRNIILLSSIFLLILFFTVWSFFSDFKTKSEQYSNINYELNVDKFNDKLKEKIILFDKDSIMNINTNIKNSNYIKDIKIIQKRYFFDKNTLLFQTKNFNDSSWNLTNVMVDIKYGEIQKLAGSSYYEFIPSSSFNKNEQLILRYQLFKNNDIKNFVILLNVNLFENSKEIIKQEEEEVLIDSFAKTTFQDNIRKELTINNVVFAVIEYNRNKDFVKNEINDFLIKLLIYSSIIFLSMFLIILFYQKYLKRKYLLQPLKYLDEVVSNIVESKFININVDKFSNMKDYTHLLKNLSKLSSNIASLKNELNINKETLERNLLTDNLTGLYDKKMFDIDMKSMFVYSGEGYLFSLKIAKLDEILKLNGSVNTDSFILSYSNIINNVINSYPHSSMTFYRFYGSEFLIIARDINYTEAVKFSNSIIDALSVQILKNYKLPEDIFHIGGTPFDTYGTIDSIMDSLEKAYQTAVSKRKNNSVIIKESQIQQDVLKLEEKVKLIVTESNFLIDFIYDSYSFENKLIMRELKPILKDYNGNTLPIGSFISICEKLELNKEFDKKVILKAVSFIEKKQIDYKIAINLSIKTIANIKFIEFIKKLVEEKANVLNHILFSITSYSASAYKVEFTEFVREMNKLNIEVLIKRFKTKEFPLEELSLVKVDYIKIDRDLTQGIHNNLIKKHRVKNIVIFAELNDIKILAENVESDSDYEYLNKLDLYAINR